MIMKENVFLMSKLFPRYFVNIGPMTNSEPRFFFKRYMNLVLYPDGACIEYSPESSLPQAIYFLVAPCLHSQLSVPQPSDFTAHCSGYNDAVSSLKYPSKNITL